MTFWARFKDWFGRVWGSIGHEFQSRKFRTLLAGLLTTYAAYLSGNVDERTALVAAIGLFATYITGVAVEDGLSRRG